MVDRKEGIRRCEECASHPKISENLIKMTKDMDYLCQKMNKQCDEISGITKEVGDRLRIKSFYILLTGLSTILIFILGMQFSSYNQMSEIKSEVKTGLAVQENQMKELTKRVDRLVTEQTVLVDNVLILTRENRSNSKIKDKH